MSAVRQASHSALAAPQADWMVLIAAVLLAALGLVMVMSTSIMAAADQYGDPFHFASRHMVFLLAGLLLALLVYQIPLKLWQTTSPLLYLASLLALALVLVPGIGREAFGASRWIQLPGGINVQPSDWARLFSAMFLAALIAARPTWVHDSWKGVAIPLLLVSVPAALIYVEPDLGATVLLVATAAGLMFLAGLRWSIVGAFSVLGSAGLYAAVMHEDFRISRVVSFLDPWSYSDGVGYQLTQAYIALARGEWFGVGLGAGVGKLFHLPEGRHTDFVLATVGEELGLFGVLIVLLLFAVLALRGFSIARRAWDAGLAFPALLAYGVSLSLGLQVLISVAVNLGLLPTKGLTMPFLSYGGNALLVSCVMVALLLRVRSETRLSILPSAGKRRRKR